MAEAFSLRTLRVVLWSLVVVAALGATALFIFRPAAVSGPGGGSYALVDQKGNPVDQSIMVGQPSLLFFGFTHCPDVCPTTLGEMEGWFAALGEEATAKSLQVVFVTVDPARDTPEILDGYVGWMSAPITALTGPQGEIDKAVKAWRASAEKVGEGDNYTMNHTASVFMVDSRGQFFGTIVYEESTETALGKIRRLLASS